MNAVLPEGIYIMRYTARDRTVALRYVVSR